MAKQLTGRLDAIDMLRGLAVAAMILVNNPGSWSYIYSPLRHANWHGYTPTDLVFPFFLFVVGVSVVYAFQSVNSPSISLFKQVAVRSAKLVGCGLFLALFYYNFNDPSFSWIDDKLKTVRWLGVLQRIAIVYFVVSVLVLLFSWRVWLLALVVLNLLYLALMSVISVPMPDGSVVAANWEQGTNLAAYIDVKLLGAAHVWAQTTPWAYDPEGVLSTLPAITTCLLGALSAKLMLAFGTQSIRAMSIMGLALVMLAYAIQSWVPINKALWTPSFVAVTSGFAILGLALFIWLTEVKAIDRPLFVFKVFGANAIAAYMAAEIGARILMMVPVGSNSLSAVLYQLLSPIFGEHLASLVYALTMVSIVFLLTFWLYRRKIFIKI